MMLRIVRVFSFADNEVASDVNGAGGSDSISAITTITWMTPSNEGG